MSIFNLNKLKQETVNNNRYERRLSKLASMGQEVDRIKSVVESAVLNIGKNQRSFVIYGEPQSGKTEMMIALTAKILDIGFKIVVILLNDSVQLLEQNIESFQRSGLSPSPKKFNEVLPNEVKIGDHQWVIFCKKNSKDLNKLIQKLYGHKERVIIDDEADYATPNSKINRQEKSKINELTGTLIGEHGTYIGVTATPARLDLNKTHDNQNEHWIDFPPHSNYTGQDLFFPVSIDTLPYSLIFLPDAGDNPIFLREALFSFMVNVGFLNTSINDPEQNYSKLVHTSGKKADHTVDYKQIVKTFEILKDSDNPSHEPYFKNIWEIARERYPDNADEITKYILANCDRNNIVVMNSDREVNAADNKTATDPTAPFTIIIGGNIVSRGVTFRNLLSMFFTRDVKHKLQQDTYIQRARMFGYRANYLKYFELVIPKTLYLDWQKCFIFHRLSLESRKQNKHSPVWLDGQRITAVASASIDKTNVDIDNGEMSFGLFEYDSENIQEIIRQEIDSIRKIKAMAELLGRDCLPEYLLNYIENFCPLGNQSIAVHEPKSISGYSNKPGELDKINIVRAKGFIGKREREEDKFPNAIHHINILFNDQGKARVFYKYQGNIRFLKTSKKEI
ncbi:MAG: Z1 domain-containing protein [Candidatus Marinimicrobia bacterium]|nr:Z1 domain-containing protein [Candidatus Neomarinimicrobiota bacterium]